MNPNEDLIRRDDVCEMLGIGDTAITPLARSRGWQAVRFEKFLYYKREDIEAELARRCVGKSTDSALRFSARDLAVAERCVRLIREFWAKRGYAVHVEAIGVDIVSDMINGFPVRR